VGAFEAFSQQAAHGAGGRAEVENRFGFQQQRLQPAEQAIPGHRVHEIRVVKTGRGAVKTTPYVSQSKQGRKVTRFFGKSRRFHARSGGRCGGA